MEQGIDNCEAYDGYLAFMQKPPLKKIKQKNCNGNKRSTSFEEEQLSRKN